MAQTPTKCELAIKIKKAPVGPSRQAAFFGLTSLTGHCGHSWIRLMCYRGGRTPLIEQ